MIKTTGSGYQPNTIGTDTGSLQTPPTTGSVLDQYNNDCPNKLPCGVCRLTNQMCPKFGGWQIDPVWTCSTSGGSIGSAKIEAKM
jgi:hypothetical protein